MTVPHIVDPARLLAEALSDASPDLMRNLLQTMINARLSADADAVAGAEWGRPSPDRVTQRNGYRFLPIRGLAAQSRDTSSSGQPKLSIETNRNPIAYVFGGVA